MEKEIEYIEALILAIKSQKKERTNVNWIRAFSFINQYEPIPLDMTCGACYENVRQKLYIRLRGLNKFIGNV